MAESRIRDENFYMVQGWMINQLGLKGVPLNVYAIIYGFSQDGENEYTGSVQYLCDFTGGTTKPTIIKALKDLVEKEYIIRREEFINGVQFNRYKVNLPLLKNFNGGSKEILPNNKLDNNINKEIDIMTEFESLWKQYPRKIGKPKALKAYKAARKNGTTYEEVLNGITLYRQQIEAQKTATEYIKHGSTWFNGECWADDYGFTTPAQTYGANGIAIDPTKTDLDDIF